MKNTLLCLSCLFFLATSVAQVKTINIRGRKPDMPSVRGGAGTLRGGGDHQAMELIVSVPDAAHLVMGKAG